MARRSELRGMGLKNIQDGGEAILEAFRDLRRRVRHFIAGLGMAVVMGGDGAAEEKRHARSDLSGLRSRDLGGRHGDRIHADDRPHAGGAAPCRSGAAAGQHGDLRRAGHGGADAGDVGRIDRLWRGRFRSRPAVVSQPERRRRPAAAGRSARQDGRTSRPPSETLYQSVVRAGEMAQRTPRGPTYLCVSMESDARGMVEAGAAARGCRRRPSPALGR